MTDAIENVLTCPCAQANYISIYQNCRKLIEIRNNTYNNSTLRASTDYKAYPSNLGEVETQHYPNWRIIRYPRKYEVAGNVDANLCSKSSKKSRGFNYGVFSCSCCCSKNICLGNMIICFKISVTL